MEHIYDMLVLGGGPAGYTAALYATRAGLDTLVVEKLSPGGQMTQTAQIDNYPGFDQGIDGYALGDAMKKSAERFGAKTMFAEVLSVELTGPVKHLETDSGRISGRTAVIAAGADHKHLGLKDEEAYVGRGLAYCAACDGMLYRGKTVAVVGGGNSAVADALLLSRICQKVILIHRRDSLRASKIYHAQLAKADNIEIRWNSTVSGLSGEEKLSSIILTDGITGAVSELAVDGLFVSIGRSPATGLLQGQVELDAQGYILAGEDTCTNLSGVFAAGDVRTKALRQIVTATADGAVAAHYAEQYLLQG